MDFWRLTAFYICFRNTIEELGVKTIADFLAVGGARVDSINSILISALVPTV
jgi:hypothetical protein